jgi:SNF2 family DNA or RNA helicase
MAFLKTKTDKLGNPVVPGMKVSLMPHQLIGAKWMAERENNPAMGHKVKVDDGKNRTYGRAKRVNTVGGGLLADEMGLGKTIQSIALMVHNRPKPEDHVKVSIPFNHYYSRKTTLIVAPLALIHQWKREIEKRTKTGLFKVHIHHGSGQLKTEKEFLQNDVVITTYGTLMQGYRKMFHFRVLMISLSHNTQEERHDRQ